VKSAAANPLPQGGRLDGWEQHVARGGGRAGGSPRDGGSARYYQRLQLEARARLAREEKEAVAAATAGRRAPDEAQPPAVAARAERGPALARQAVAEQALQHAREHRGVAAAQVEVLKAKA
jgi:hypothetical protein